MHAYTFKKGSTNVSIELEIIDDTDGTPETGVVWNTAGIDLQYRRDAAASTAITEATLAALTTAHTDGGFLHIGNGVYRFDLPDAALASGADKVVIHGTVTGMIVIPCVIQLVDYDLFDGTRLGLTALPNAAADAAGGLPISDAGGLDLDAKVGALTYTVANQLDTNVLAISGDTTAADNLELQYDGTGLTGDTYPSTQAQVGNLSSGSAAISTVAESYTLTTGTQSSGTVTSTEARDDVAHQHTDTAGAMELYYQFSVGGNGVAASVSMYGYLTSTNDSLDVFAYDWAGASWDQVGTLDGSSAASIDHIYNLTTSHTGTGANLGKVRLRFYAASGLTSATLSVDYIACAYAVVSQSVGYDGGQVWIDTADGVAGTESFVNGVADNPALTLADAKTIATNVGLHKFNASNESTITLASSSTNEEYAGVGWTLALGGQDISGSTFIGANSVTGTCTSPTGESHFIECEFGNATIGNGHYKRCGFGGTLTLNTATDYFMVDCYSQVAGASSPVIDMGAAVGATNLSIRRWAGGLTINNLAAGDVVTLDGTFGTVTLNGADAQVEIRGIAKAVTNNLTGTPTVNDDTVKADDVALILADTGTDGVALSAAQMNKIADHVLRRAFATAAASADGDTKDFRSLLGATAKLVNKVAISGSTLSIYEADDTTALGTQTLTTDAAADPITGADTV